MLRWRRLFGPTDGDSRANGLAASIACLAIGFLYLEMPPSPVGAETVHRTSRKASRSLATVQPVPTTDSQALASVVEIAPATDLNVSPAELALRNKMRLLHQGRDFLQKSSDYRAIFSRQELVAGELLDEQCMELKVRHAPFSVYLKWLEGDVGREVLYVAGANNGKMVVHAGGWKARLPSLTIEPDSSLAMGESRYPITRAGLLELIHLMTTSHDADLLAQNFTRCEQLADEEFDGRPCDSFVLEYRDAQSSPVYRKSVVLLDKEWHVPVYTQNYGWPDSSTAAATGEALDEATLIEFYTYSELQFGTNLADADFDRTNEEYKFH